MAHVTQINDEDVEVLASGRALLFDMDGTLVDSTSIVETLWHEFAAVHGLVAQDVISFAHGRQTVETMSNFLPNASQRKIQELAAAFTDTEITRTDDVIEVPGAYEMLSSLAEMRAPYALVTSASAALAHSRMRAAGLPLPPVIVTKEDVRNSKPHPEGYFLAASLLGIDPRDAIVFEDSVAGIEAGKQSGATVIAIGARPVDHHPSLYDYRHLLIRPRASFYSVLRSHPSANKVAISASGERERRSMAHSSQKRVDGPSAKAPTPCSANERRERN